ncbi:MAG: 7-carboxy-7-deazaguanine synthase QueE [Rikenellaceae bacterium]
MTKIDEFCGGKKLPLVEDFYSIQGEGFHTGKPAYFIRLGGCDVGCKWCDAKFTWNSKAFEPVSSDLIVDRAFSFEAKSIVITGGEPLMYPMDYLTKALRAKDMEIFLETSGSHPLSGEFDWICLSPKRQQPPLEPIFSKANELKVIIESLEDFVWAEENAAKVSKDCYLYLQPEWSKYKSLINSIVEYAKSNPRWMISVQTHKFMNIP